MSFYPYPPIPPSPWIPPIQSSSFPAPIYTILITGMVLFMASNVMPNLLPALERIFNVAPRVLMWGFWLILLTLLANMTGTIPGVPQLHLTYVHMTVAALIFVLMWNQLATEIPLPPPDAPAKSSSSSSSSREKPKEAKPEKKEEKPAVKASPWDDLRAHPSAFLTTRLNRAAMWPFPMGKAAKVGPELWWESGMPSHVGHSNKPESPPGVKEEKKKKSDDGDKDKEKEKEKEKEKAKEKDKEKLKEAEKAKIAEKEAAAKKKMKEEEMRKAMEAKKAAESAGGMNEVDSGAKKAAQDAEERQKQKLWRTKALMMIVGISLLSKSLGFLLLLFFSLQMISQELNGPSPIDPSQPASASPSKSSSSSSSSSRPATGSTSDREAEKAKMAKAQAMKEAEREKVSASASGSGSSGSSRDREKEKEGGKSSSSSSSASGEKERSSSSSSKPKEKSELVTGDAVREASGSKTKTNVDGGEGGDGPTPAFLGMGMHYIHTRGIDGQLDGTGSANIPSDGMPHPLMTSFMRGYAG